MEFNFKIGFRFESINRPVIRKRGSEEGRKEGGAERRRRTRRKMVKVRERGEVEEEEEEEWKRNWKWSEEREA